MTENNKIRIVIGSTPHDSSVYLNDVLIPGIVGIRLGVDTNAMTWVGLDIMGEVELETGFAEEDILSIRKDFQPLLRKG